MAHYDFRKNRKEGEHITFKSLWFKESAKKLRLVYSKEELPDKDLLEFLNEEYEKRTTITGRFVNNVLGTNQHMTIEGFINKFINSDYILTGFCTLFESHKTRNLSSEILDGLLITRSKHKHKMEASEKGTIAYTSYKILQLTYKILANSYYGITGLASSVFFNQFIQNSTTFTGQDIITSSIVAFEDFLGNNCKYTSLDDVSEFINNVKFETHGQKILDWVDEPVTAEFLAGLLSEKTSPNVDLITPESILPYLARLDSETLTRIYYKNRPSEFMKNKKVKDYVEKVLNLEGVDGSNGYNAKLAEGVEDPRPAFVKLINDFTFYDHVLEDRYRRAVKETRGSVTVIDTDSNFIALYKHVHSTIDLFGYEKNENTELNVVNMYIDICTEMLVRIYWTLTTNLGIEDEWKSRIEMKNEFVYLAMLLTKNKKSYAGKLLAENGKYLAVKDNKADDIKRRLDMKGIEIRKSTTSQRISELFIDILYDDILSADEVDLGGILDKYDEIENIVRGSLSEGKSEFSVPKNCASFQSYSKETLMRQQPVRGTIIWNALEPENKIVPPEKVNIFKLKTIKQDCPELIELSETHPDKYKIIIDTVFTDKFDADNNPIYPFGKNGMNVIAVPKTVERLPDYLLPLVDMDMMTNSSLKAGNILLESLGIFITSKDNSSFKSNIFVG